MNSEAQHSEAQLGQTDFIAPNLAIGQPFPDILLPSLAEGQPRSIRQFQGRKTLLHIFASW